MPVRVVSPMTTFELSSLTRSGVTERSPSYSRKAYSDTSSSSAIDFGTTSIRYLVSTIPSTTIPAPVLALLIRTGNFTNPILRPDDAVARYHLASHERLRQLALH